jgi:hypothetical protein
MPIRIQRKHLYPANWKSEIVPAVRARSGDCCEWCGVRNHQLISRSPDKQNWGIIYMSPFPHFKLSLTWLIASCAVVLV